MTNQWNKIRHTKKIGQIPFATPDFLNKSYLPSLDGWRAIAILLVILGHAKFTAGVSKPVHGFLETFVYAELGVKIFFVLSGFLITTLLIKEHLKNGWISLKAFTCGVC